jgi:lipopolysaccharide export system protein LptC
MTIASSTSSSPLPHHAGRQRAMAAARSHTSLVRVLRVAVPGLAVLVVAAFFAIIATDPRNALTSSENAQALGVQSGTITMEAPHLTGFNANGQTYEVIAKRAEQRTDDPGKVALNALIAKVQMRSEGFAHFTAGSGRFDTAQQILDLGDKVTAVTDKGDDAALATAHIDLKAGSVSTDRPVKIKLGTATLSADSMTLSNSGDHVIFSGKVVMILPPAGAAPAATPGAHQ